MRIRFDNVNFSSPSGPNAFATRLAKQLALMGHTLSDPGDEVDVQLSVIAMTQSAPKIVLRLDGIYFNSEQDWNMLNEPIKRSYDQVDGVIVQSDFDDELIKRYFGVRENVRVIRNGTDIDEIGRVLPIESEHLDRFESVWCCASSWRPHKRLSENVRYFMEHAGSNDCLVIAGENPDVRVSDPRVFYAGHMDRPVLLSLYRRSSHFLHLAMVDHCPNVVIDARASGCHVVCASSGGTREIAGPGATVVQDSQWDWEPFELYKPPKLDFSKQSVNEIDHSIDIRDVALEYASFFEEVVSE